MKLVPFILTQKKNGLFTISKLSLFLSHAGKSLWQTEESGLLSQDTLQEEYLLPNGFPVDHMEIDKAKRIAYVQVDKGKMNLSDFYTWEEALTKPDKPECWRHFYFIQDKEGADWWSPKGLLEAELPEVGNLGDLFVSLQSIKRDT